jgi:hypothetical protein
VRGDVLSFQAVDAAMAARDAVDAVESSTS